MAKQPSKAQVIKDNPQFKSLINAVINQLGGTDDFENILEYGITGGYPGFTYYADTHPFAIKNRKQIVALLEYSADQLGEDVTVMVSNFGVFRNRKMDSDDKRDLYRYLGGSKVEQGAITNVMAWFACEEVARMFEAFGD